MMKRSCPACGRPAVSVWRLLSLGGLRTASCVNCGTKIGVSWLSSLVVLTFGTWIPVAGSIIGAMTAAGISSDGDGVLIGGAAGLVLCTTLFAALYFRSAKLIVI